MNEDGSEESGQGFCQPVCSNRQDSGTPPPLIGFLTIETAERTYLFNGAKASRRQ